MPFTFKTEKSTGKYRSFYPPTHNIKLKKKCCGTIGTEPPHRIRLTIMKDEKHTDKNQNCPWIWIGLNYDFNSLDEAKKFLNDNFDRLTKQFNFHLMD